MSDEKIQETGGKRESGAPAEGAAGADQGATHGLVDAERRRIWQEGLVQEALDNRPELREAFGEKLGFETSRAKGYERGFEDAARTLTPAQLQGIGNLKAKRVARYLREELPRDLQAYLAREAAGMDEGGFLIGYVDGAAECLEALRRRIHELVSE